MGCTYSKVYQVKIVRDLATDNIVAELWYNLLGKLDRDGNLPALLHYNPGASNVVQAEWRKSGRLQREGAPTALWYDPNTGAIIQESWYVRSVLHRDNREPALISRDAISGAIIDQEFWRCGKKLMRRQVFQLDDFLLTANNLMFVFMYINCVGLFYGRGTFF